MTELKGKISIYEKLTELQNTVNVPKNQHNSYGNYNYRKVEDIMEALKRPLRELKLNLIVADDMVIVNDRIYVKATVTLTNIETTQQIQVSAFAREVEDKKGMDLAQITGAASSYARKYALSGLLLLDDNKEPDMMNNNNDDVDPKPKKIEKMNKARKDRFIKMCNAKLKERGVDDKDIPDIIALICKMEGVKSLESVDDTETATRIYKDCQTIKIEDKKPKEEKKDGK